MEVKSKTLTEIFSSNILEVPFFQRSYVWNRDNWEELLDDLFEDRKTYFLGTIILKEKIDSLCKLKIHLIIDGQQRLTTLSILIKALYDCIENEETKKNLFTGGIRSLLFYKEEASDGEYKIILQHSHNDRKPFEYVIGEVEGDKIKKKDLKDNDINDFIQKSMIMKCYNYFYAELSNRYNENEQKVIDLCNRLLSTKTNIMAVIHLNEDDNEQKIFDSINTAGIRLSATDTIKNALYKRLLELSDKKEKVIEYYKNTWERTFEDVDAIEFWCKTKSVGRISYQNSELLLKGVAMIRGIFKYSEGHSMEQLAGLYKKVVSSKDELFVKNLIEDIIGYAKIYRERLSNFDKEEEIGFNDTEKKLLMILNVNENTVFNPYILYLLHRYENDKNTLEIRLGRLEKLVVKKLITGFFEKNYSKLIEEFIKDDNDIKITELCNEIDKNMLKQALAEKVSNKIASMLLFFVELYRRSKNNNGESNKLPYTYQLEHIMPKKWEEHWSGVHIGDKNKTLCNTEELKQRRNEKIVSIGNMTLLKGKLNSMISNDTFKRKVEGNGKNKGLKDCTYFSITRDDIIKNVYEKNKEWNEAEITKRERALINEIIEIWG